MINDRDYLLQETKMNDIRCLIWQAAMHLNKAQAFPVMCDRGTNKKKVIYLIHIRLQVCFALIRMHTCVLVFYMLIWTLV